MSLLQGGDYLYKREGDKIGIVTNKYLFQSNKFKNKIKQIINKIQINTSIFQTNTYLNKINKVFGKKAKYLR